MHDPTPALARATEALDLPPDVALEEYPAYPESAPHETVHPNVVVDRERAAFEAGWLACRAAAPEAVAAALRDREAIRQALRTADDDYQAREHEANVSRGPEPGDWWLFLVNAMVDHLLGQDDPSTAAILGTAR